VRAWWRLADEREQRKDNPPTNRHRNPSVYSLLVSPPADWFFVLRRLVVRLRDRDTGSVRTVGQGQGKTVHRQTDSTFSLPLVGLSVSSFFLSAGEAKRNTRRPIERKKQTTKGSSRPHRQSGQGHEFDSGPTVNKDKSKNAINLSHRLVDGRGNRL